jgi:prolyl oligopeptidase PreP (S9A serine peptidase family)
MARGSAKSVNWIEAEDKCTAAVLSALPGRAEIARRLTELMRVDTCGLPQERRRLAPHSGNELPCSHNYMAWPDRRRG